MNWKRLIICNNSVFKERKCKRPTTVHRSVTSPTLVDNWPSYMKNREISISFRDVKCRWQYCSSTVTLSSANHSLRVSVFA
jgi:hypothetical protein